MTRKYEPQPGADNVLFKIGCDVARGVFHSRLDGCKDEPRRAAAAPHPYRLPSVNIKQPVIWGSTCEGPDGIALSFGGEDAGCRRWAWRTRGFASMENGSTCLSRYATDPRARGLASNPDASRSEKDLLAQARTLYFSGLTKAHSNSSELRRLADQDRRYPIGVRPRALVMSNRSVSRGWQDRIDLMGFANSESKINRSQKLLEAVESPKLSLEIREVQVDLERSPTWRPPNRRRGA